MSALERIAELLYRVMGLDAQSIGSTAISHAVGQRLIALQGEPNRSREAPVQDAATLDAYYAQLLGSAEEVQQLIEAVVVPETWFFRDGDAFTALLRLTRELRARMTPARRVRILSLPCSTGEEPYSIAMTLLDGGIDASMMHIDAVDISTLSIAFARQGVYGKNSFRADLGSVRERYFKPVGAAFQIDAAVRAAVNFHQGNLFEPLALLTPESYDFIFCRNVLIYFDRQGQDKAVSVLTQALAAHGTLFVGPAETALLGRHPLTSIKIAFAFGFHKASLAPNPGAAPAGAAAMARTVPAAAAAAKSPPPRLAGNTPPLPGGAPRGQARPPARPAPAVAPAAAPATRAGSGAVAGAATASTAKDQPLSADALLAQAFNHADQGRLDAAAQSAREHAARHGASAASFYLLGLVSDANQDAATARGYYRKALYMEPRHREALTHLAVLLALEGDHEGARTMRERAARLGAEPATRSKPS